MPRLVSFSTLTLALLAFAADPASAAACTIPVHSVIVSDAPANGLVRISVQCATPPCFAGDVPDPLLVEDALTGESIPGRVLRVAHGGRGSDVLWLPDAPLEPGSSYEPGQRFVLISPRGRINTPPS